MDSDSQRIGVQEQLIKQQLHVKRLEEQINELQKSLQSMSENNSMTQTQTQMYWPMTAGERVQEPDYKAELSIDTLTNFEIVPKTKPMSSENQQALKSALRRSTSRKMVKTTHIILPSFQR